MPARPAESPRHERVFIIFGGPQGRRGLLTRAVLCPAFRAEPRPAGSGRALFHAAAVLVCVAALLAAATVPSASVTQHMVLLEPAESQLVVRESLIVENAGDAAFADAKNGVVRVFVPDAGVSSLGVMARAPGQSSVELKPVPAGLPQVYKVDFSLPPGETRFDFSYSIPFKNPGTFSGRILHRDGAVNLVVPAGVSVKGDGLEPAGQEPQTNAAIYSLKLLNYTVELQGTGSMSAAPADQPDPGSSLDEIPPRVYGSLYPILGLSFGILALGFVLFYRMRASAPASLTNAKRRR
jgi:hypothetical protein